MSGWPAAVAAGWHPVARLDELGGRLLARRLMDVPMVVFAGRDGPIVLRDRCPHRAMPLSAGRLAEGAIACPYHGWRFGAGGRCVEVPGAVVMPDVAADAFPVIVRAGLVWTSLAPAPADFPRLPAAMEDESLDRFWWAVAASRARCLDALENHLDPAHPHYLHPWMVRAPDRRRPVRVTIRIDADGAEAVYREDSRPAAWMPRLLEGHRLRSIGRYHPPTIGEVAFEGEKGLKLSIAVVFVPESADFTRPYAHFATPRGRAPAWLKRWVLKAFHGPVLRQDRRALAMQAAAIAEQGEGRYAIGPLDLLGPAIWGFANGRPPAPMERELELLL